MSELERRRDELQQVIAAGLTTVAQLLATVSDAVTRAAETLEAIANKIEAEEPEPPVGSTGPTGVVPPVAPPIEPDPTGPTGPPVNP